MTRLVQRIAAALASYRLSIACIAGLFLLTWLGTLHQVEHGLWAAQRKYFESWWLWQRLGDLFVGADVPRWLDDASIALPLPGGITLLSLLALNLVGGGFVRVLRSLATGTRVLPRIGVLTVHAGIALLLLAGFVRFARATEGSITLLEGQSIAHYTSFHDWELVVARQVGDGEIEEHRIDAERFIDRAAPVTFHSPRLPFAITVERSARNAEVRPRTSGHGFDPASAEAFELHPRPPRLEHEKNLAGCAVAVRGADGDALRAVLGGADRAPWTVAHGDERWALSLRKTTYPLPFTLRLERFTAVMHPGTQKPKAFRSEVSVDEPERGARRVRIEMNEPLRLGDVVVYQSSWGAQGAGPDAPLFSGFQVVQNPADAWPLYGCILVAAGMLLAFGCKLLRFLRRETAGSARPVAAGLLLLASGAPAVAQEQPPRAQAWDPATVERFARLPVQDDGRIQPFLTRVSYLLLRLHGRRTLSVPDEPRFGAAAGRSLGATEWGMDALFFPAQADRYPAFQVQTSEVLDALELAHEGKRKRDRYSFEELRPGLARLFALAERYDRIPEQERSGIEEQIVRLARNLRDYDRLVRSLDAARLRFAAGESLRALAGGRDEMRFSDVVEHWPELLAMRAAPGGAAAGEILARVRDLATGRVLLHWLPPPGASDPRWLSAPELPGLRERQPAGATIAVQRTHERLLDARDDPAAFAHELRTLETQLAAALRARGERDTLDLEVRYLQADWVFRALCAFGLGFLLVCIGWLRPRSRLLAAGAWLATAAGAALLATGIVIRCVLRERPPISGLYETILFVSGTIVVVALVVELCHRRRIGLSLAALLGFAGMFLAGRFEASEGRDTMPTLQAVLDTNFWLATHVTVINLGYAGALLAGFLAHFTLLGAAFAGARFAPDARRTVARATYGTICFATLFTTVGTILGGIWANDSWGRFWGWDPKENGALMIVLWNLLILHARLGGLVAERGIALLAVAGNVVVVFSWFHTNLLGVGLHSYGFASGLSAAVWSFYAFELAVLSAGAWRTRRGAGITLAA